MGVGRMVISHTHEETKEQQPCMEEGEVQIFFLIVTIISFLRRKSSVCFEVAFQLKKSKETFKWIGLLEVTFNINQCRTTETLLLPGH